ncbi:MAG: hypothetical protein EOP10_01830 [Proteobacteria bacterium]|nr:MAG: hypothetical protein EOP10_01830 [Pseudomonadota bacterium]
MVNQTKAFLARELFNRIQLLVSKNGFTFSQATHEVLRPEEKYVACLYSDIRKFTKSSRDEKFVKDGAIPNIIRLTQVAEEFRGIPRNIGDLLFVYFDFEYPLSSLYAALCSALTMVRKNADFNRLYPASHVTRHIIVTFGQASVGNIGGISSAREVTVLGSPANKSNRIDLLTKDSKFQKLIEDDEGIIVSSEVWQFLNQNHSNLVMKHIDLRPLALKIPDFEEDNDVYFISIDQLDSALENHARIRDDA